MRSSGVGGGERSCAGWTGSWDGCWLDGFVASEGTYIWSYDLAETESLMLVVRLDRLRRSSGLEEVCLRRTKVTEGKKTSEKLQKVHRSFVLLVCLGNTVAFTCFTR